MQNLLEDFEKFQIHDEKPDTRTRYVYEVQTTCSMKYIGQTVELKNRVTKHNRDMKNHTNTTLGRHAQTCESKNCHVEKYEILAEVHDKDLANKIEKMVIQERGNLNVQHNPNRSKSNELKATTSTSAPIIIPTASRLKTNSTIKSVTTTSTIHSPKITKTSVVPVVKPSKTTTNSGPPKRKSN